MWTIFARGDDSRKLSAWLSAHAAEFTHMGRPLQQLGPQAVAALGPVLSQRYILSQAHRETLKADTGVTDCILSLFYDSMYLLTCALLLPFLSQM